MLEILYKSENVIVVNKPQGMPSAPDPTRDKDAMSLASEMLRKDGERGDLWLVHRLDRGTGGTIMFARNAHTASVLSQAVREHQSVKEYLAVAEGTVPSEEIEDYLYKDTVRSRAIVADSTKKGAKLARLKTHTLDTVKTEKGERSLVYITLETGRFHQIRAQLSHRGYPIVGDGKYGSRDKRAHVPALYAVHLALTFENEIIDCKAYPDTSVYPWCLFDCLKK